MVRPVKRTSSTKITILSSREKFIFVSPRRGFCWMRKYHHDRGLYQGCPEESCCIRYRTFSSAVFGQGKLRRFLCRQVRGFPCLYFFQNFVSYSGKASFNSILIHYRFDVFIVRHMYQPRAMLKKSLSPNGERLDDF